MAGEVDYFDPNFKYPQNFRASLGFDQRLPGGFILTLDGYYAKQVNQIYLQDTNIPQDPTFSSEGRAVYGTFNAANGRGHGGAAHHGGHQRGVSTRTRRQGQTLAGTIQVQKSFANHFALERRLHLLTHHRPDLGDVEPGVLELPVRVDRHRHHRRSRPSPRRSSTCRAR